MDYHQRLYRERTATAQRRAALLGALSLEARPSEPHDMRRLRQLDALRSSRMPTMATVASAAGAATVALANDAWKEHMPMEERTSSKALLATIEQRVYHAANPRFLPPDGRSLIRRNLKLAPIERLLRLQCATSSLAFRFSSPFKHSLCTPLITCCHTPYNLQGRVFARFATCLYSKSSTHPFSHL